MKSRRRIAAVLAAFLIASSGSAIAAPHSRQGKGKDKTVGDKIRGKLPPSEPIFMEQERVIIRNWFHDRREGLPPGLAKRDRLPPGLEKQIRKRGTLPPGLQKKVQPLPVELERQLRVLPTGYRRVIVGGNVVLMNEKTALIYDIVRVIIP
jgi:hypothetical protein